MTEPLNADRPFPAWSPDDNRGNLPNVRRALVGVLQRISTTEYDRPSMHWLITSDFNNTFKEHAKHMQSKESVNSSQYIAQTMDNLKRPLEWITQQWMNRVRTTSKSTLIVCQCRMVGSGMTSMPQRKTTRVGTKVAHVEQLTV